MVVLEHLFVALHVEVAVVDVEAETVNRGLAILDLFGYSLHLDNFSVLNSWDVLSLRQRDSHFLVYIIISLRSRKNRQSLPRLN